MDYLIALSRLTLAGCFVTMIFAHVLSAKDESAPPPRG
jgi:hypothetical protein